MVYVVVTLSSFAHLLCLQIVVGVDAASLQIPWIKGMLTLEHGFKKVWFLELRSLQPLLSLV